MTKKWITLTFIVMIIVIGLSGTVIALPYNYLPILTGLVVESTSDTGVSSSLSLSTSTNIVSSGISSSGQQSSILKDVIPNQWQPGVRDGMFFDPLSKTSWVFDRILKKYYSPDKQWLLIGQYTTGTNPRLIRQYYYDPADMVFLSINTGEKVPIDQSGVYDLPSLTTSVTS